MNKAELKDLKALLQGHLPEENTVRNHSRAGGNNLQDVLSGNYLAAGEVFKISSSYPYDMTIGKRKLRCYRIPEIVHKYSGSGKLELGDIVFLDTETTGLGTGSGTFVFLVGLGYFTEKDFTVDQYLLDRLSGEQHFLESIISEISSYCGIVTFNGKSFDMPLLRNRFIFNGLTAELPDLWHLDLLHLTRRLWQNSLSGYDLQNIEQQVLGFWRNPGEDIPGEKIPEVYRNYLQDRDASFLKNIVLHNRTDILSLVILLDLIAELITGDIRDCFEWKFRDESGIGKLFEQMRDEVNAIRCFERSIRIFDDDRVSLKRLSFLLKKRGEVSRAEKLWEKAAACDEIYAMVELAKLEEHQRKNYVKALEWTLRAHNLLQQRAMVNSGNFQSLIKRSNRLQQKLNRDKIEDD
ncbi:MAG: ribonuclease H-like domain-containing protein [Candidatus Cloacimonetes bacterium]|nr:ribonuclease H-like domain-containing protein [Candidatus Cloacimonadota bacterium]